jgi:hypothetical protein
LIVNKISGNHKNQRHQRAIENRKKSAEIIKNQRHQRAIKKAITTNANGTTSDS